MRDPGVDVVITTGGTGFTGRDVTPEAIEPLFDKRMDGFSTVFHQLSFDKIGTSTIQSRATAGLIGTTFVFVLPGSPGRLPGRLGRHPEPPARLPVPALQFRRDHAAARRASAAQALGGRICPVGFAAAMTRLPVYLPFSIGGASLHVR